MLGLGWQELLKWLWRLVASFSVTFPPRRDHFAFSLTISPFFPLQFAFLLPYSLSSLPLDL